MTRQDALRQLPAVDQVAKWPELTPLQERIRVDAVRRGIHTLRKKILTADEPHPPVRAEIIDAILVAARDFRAPYLVPVINATGVLIHTNLGRAPLGAKIIQAALEVSQNSNLELLLDSGKRGGRGEGVKRLLCALSGAEDAVVANNCAAAVLLGVSAIAAGGEVIVSRGELVEIGGSFRVPDVIIQGGATLREVGTTNRTKAKDFERAIEPQTRAMLKAHRSNFYLAGFSESVSIQELVEIKRSQPKEGPPLSVLFDLGAATFLPFQDSAVHSPSPKDAIDAGADLVFFSGDKLLGGPQAGIILGSKEAIQRVKEHPLYRALRPGKITLALLEATLRAHLLGDQEALPLHQHINLDLQALNERARHLSQSLPSSPDYALKVVPHDATIGGGALPGQLIESVALSLSLSTGDAGPLACALRATTPPVIGTLHHGALLLDLRSVPASQDLLLLDALKRALIEICHD